MACSISLLLDLMEATTCALVFVVSVRFTSAINPAVNIVSQAIDINPSVDLMKIAIIVSFLQSFVLFSIFIPDFD